MNRRSNRVIDGIVVSGDRVSVLSVPQSIIDVFADIYFGGNEDYIDDSIGEKSKGYFHRIWDRVISYIQ